ncbi:MAG: MFS transporter [Rhizobiaceae bacterium]
MKQTLSNGTIALYALPALPLAALTLPLYSFIPIFYAEALGLSLASLGLVLFLVRLFDAVNDPMIGWLSDRFRTRLTNRFGRRRSWFAASIPLVMLGVWNLFWPPQDAGVAHVGLWTLVLSVGYTCAILPFSAWGAELLTSYQGRSRVAGWREGMTLVGTLVAISVPFSLGWANAGEFHGFALLAVIVVVTLPVFALLAVNFAPEPVERSHTRVSLKDGVAHMRQNRPFLRLLLAFFLNGFGNSIAATLFLLYCAQRLELEELRGPLIFIYFLSGIIGVPFWSALAKRTSKHRAWCIAMIFAAIVFCPAPFLPPGSAIAFGIICVLSGLALGADLMLPSAIQADVIDVDTASSGEQRSGSYFALWSLVTKLSLALTVILVLPLLELVGFSADPAKSSTAVGISLLGFLYGWGPIAFKLPALVMMWHFPIGATQVEQLKHQIDTAAAPSDADSGRKAN